MLNSSSNNNNSSNNASSSKRATTDCSTCVVDTGIGRRVAESGLRSSSNSISTVGTKGSTVKCTCTDHVRGRPRSSSGGSAGAKSKKGVSKRDMATSPNLGSKSPKILMSSTALSSCAAPANCIAPKSPSVITRSAATSPRMDLKPQRPALSPIRIDQPQWADTEDPSSRRKALRSARSLSPRPPVLHQPHAITVSDENEVVSVKLSPNDVVVAPGRAKRCQSEHASPNVFEDRNFEYDDKAIHSNRSTGCLVYVPSDPWLRMSDEDLVVSHAQANKKKKQRTTPVAKSAGAQSESPQFLFPAVKSKSKPNILNDADDPWVWKGGPKQDGHRRARNRSAAENKQLQRPALSRQAKSLQSKELSTERDLYSPQLGDSVVVSTGDVRAGRGRSREALNSTSSTNVCLQVNVSLQPRHSFSSVPSQRDDELQLNIRRLSEQVRHSRSPMGSMAAGFNRSNLGTGDIASGWERTGVPTVRKAVAGVDRDLTADEEALLETTC